jgi:hypothetical protein
MLRVSSLWLAQGQYKHRLKTRMVGYIPKVVPRKIKGALIAMRSEANTGYFDGHIKTAAERMEQSGKRLGHVIWDPLVERMVVARESKVKGAMLSKSHIQKKITTPF